MVLIINWPSVRYTGLFLLFFLSILEAFHRVYAEERVHLFSPHDAAVLCSSNVLAYVITQPLVCLLSGVWSVWYRMQLL